VAAVCCSPSRAARPRSTAGSGSRDEAGWLGLFAAAGLHVEEHELYALGPDGWRSTDALETGYGAVGPGASGVLCAELHPGRKRHAVLRAVRRAAGRYR